jgi:hypothetical protein
MSRKFSEKNERVAKSLESMRALLCKRLRSWGALLPPHRRAVAVLVEQEAKFFTPLLCHGAASFGTMERI